MPRRGLSTPSIAVVPSPGGGMADPSTQNALPARGAVGPAFAPACPSLRLTGEWTTSRDHDCQAGSSSPGRGESARPAEMLGRGGLRRRRPGSNGKQAVLSRPELRPDLVAWHRCPSSTDLGRRADRQGAHLPVVMLTAFSRRARRRARDAGSCLHRQAVHRHDVVPALDIALSGAAQGSRPR